MNATDSPCMRVVQRAAALLIGSELLNGKVQDANLQQLARTLRALGIVLERAVILRDDRSAIAGEVRDLCQRFDVVFTSGGVGPTHDDVTMAAIARAFERPLVPHPELENLLRGWYGQRCTPAHLRMAQLPAGTELVRAGDSWPALVFGNLWILPGLPEVFREMMLFVRARLRGPRPLHTLTVRTKLDESELVTTLDRVVTAHPGIEVGSYPQWRDPDCRTRVTFDGWELASVQAATDFFMAMLPLNAPASVE
ncbi:competence/damage-inducible protein A [Myxococcota bacterium]